MWNTFTRNNLKISFSILAQEDRIMQEVFKGNIIQISKDLLCINQPKNNRYVWDKPKQGESFNHITHLNIEVEEKVIPQQETLGDCILCDHKFYSCYASHMEDHYVRRHHSKALKIYNYVLLRCKCKDVPCRGLDNYKWDSHWHCAISLSMTGSNSPNF